MAKALDSGKRSAWGRVRRILAYFILAVLLVYGASNLWLCSGWGKGVAESKLKERTGFDWEVGSMFWSPWNGFTIHEARMLQPEELRESIEQPVVTVDRIRVRPYWKQLLRGRARFREIQVDSPEVVISVEMLASLASRMPVSNVTPSAQNPSAEPGKLSRKSPAPDKSGKTPSGRDLKKKPDSESMPPARPVAPVVKKRPPAGLPSWLKVNDAEMEIISVRKGVRLFHGESISLDLPVFGEDAKGVVKVGVIEIPGVPKLLDFEQTVVWKRPYLMVEKQTVNLGGVEVQCLGQVGVGRNALGRYPFLFDCVIPNQSLEPVKWFERLALEVSSDKLVGRFRVNGALLKPMSWRADALFAGEGVRVKEVHGSHDVVFDSVYVPAVFRQGQLRWNSFRMVGEDISILGNGHISAGGDVLFVNRLVVSPEVAVMLARGLHGSRMVPNGKRWWDNLGTPDRKVRDLLVSGTLADPVIDAGIQHASLPLWETVSTTLKFIRSEMKEEGKQLKPLPNQEMLQSKRNENH